MRTLSLVYGVACYLLSGAAVLYFACFLIGLDVPILAPRPGEPAARAISIDLGLIALFGLQHSGMARPAFKRWWTRFVPPSIERSTYVLASNIILAALVVLWQ